MTSSFVRRGQATKNVKFSHPVFDWCKKDKSNESRLISIQNGHLRTVVEAKILLEEFLNGLSNSTSILYLSLEDSAAAKKAAMSARLGQKTNQIIFLDCWSDAYGWNAEDQNPSEEIWRDINDTAGLVSYITEWRKKHPQDAFIVLDHISRLHHHSPADGGLLPLILQSLRQEVSSTHACHVIAFSHTELLSASAASALEYISDAIVRVSLDTTTTSQPLVKTETVLRRRSGKSQVSQELYKRTTDNVRRLVDFELTKASSGEPAKAGKQSDPTANLTFNLKLTDEENKARESVVLPYRHHLNAKEEKKSVIYLDDDDDAFNDEDDDLDI
ncbi:hypothetical protein PROFUN_05811 [Planoprotostelium fungivorum]|uniref:Elongator complex protein 5 n=1 Tax=Planoprotostelium fungivorum TaxID=1890364 RepID=A0A2P6NQ04_9EUKA|nr:hypothetical protein PROFUN_05811 [Planoprotostelium fungivorum]